MSRMIPGISGQENNLVAATGEQQQENMCTVEPPNNGYVGDERNSLSTVGVEVVQTHYQRYHCTWGRQAFQCACKIKPPVQLL